MGKFSYLWLVNATCMGATRVAANAVVSNLFTFYSRNFTAFLPRNSFKFNLNYVVFIYTQNSLIIFYSHYYGNKYVLHFYREFNLKL